MAVAERKTYPQFGPAYMKAWREKNRERLKELERQRMANPIKRSLRRASQKKYRESQRAALNAKVTLYCRERRVAGQEAALGRLKPAVCEVCGGADNGIVFDHDHETSKPRGWLCSHCNSALGYVRDDAVRLRALADYLERNSSLWMETLRKFPALA